MSESELEPGKKITPQTEQERIEAEQKLLQQQQSHEAYNKDLQELNAPDSTGDYEEEPEKKRSIIKELLIWVGVTVGIVLIIQNFIFLPFYVSGSSMEPDFHNDDYLITSKIPITMFDITKLFGQKNMDIHRGDVLIFRPPGAPDTFFIKRAIALPGERITVKDGVVTIYNQQHPDGFVLNEKYIDPQYKTEGDIDQVVEEGKVFVMGDNRSPDGSYDSRAWGQLPQQNIAGFGAFRLLPINSFMFIGRPEYPSS